MILVLGNKIFNRGCVTIDSILTSIKKLLGIEEDCINFDKDIILHINSVFFILDQLGVNPTVFFSISDKEQTWDEYLLSGLNPEVIKTYIYLKVRLIFDPPLSASLIAVIKEQIAELEWRIMISADPKPVAEEVTDYE